MGLTLNLCLNVLLNIGFLNTSLQRYLESESQNKWDIQKATEDKIASFTWSTAEDESCGRSKTTIWCALRPDEPLNQNQKKLHGKKINLLMLFSGLNETYTCPVKRHHLNGLCDKVFLHSKKNAISRDCVGSVCSLLYLVLLQKLLDVLCHWKRNVMDKAVKCIHCL